MRRALLAIVFATGCSKAELDGFVPDVSGVWQLASQVPESSDDDRLRYMELLEDGTGGIFFRRDGSGVLGCPHLLYTAQSDVLTLQIGTYEETSESELFRYHRPDPETLDLVDVTGARMVFARVPEVPPGDRCGVVTTAGSIALPEPAFFGGLAIDGSIAWYNVDSDELLGVDVLTGGTSGRLAVSSFFLVGSTESGDLWGTSLFDGSVERRSKSNTLLDQFTPGGLLDFRPYGIAWDGGALWVSRQDPDYELARFATSGEPDTVLATIPSDGSVRSIAYRGSLWALVSSWGTVLVEIDPATGAALRTLTLPRPAGSWEIVTSDGPSTADELYLLDSSSPTARIVRLATP